MIYGKEEVEWRQGDKELKSLLKGWEFKRGSKGKTESNSKFQSSLFFFITEDYLLRKSIMNFK